MVIFKKKRTESTEKNRLWTKRKLFVTFMTLERKLERAERKIEEQKKELQILRNLSNHFANPVTFHEAEEEEDFEVVSHVEHSEHFAT